MTKTALTLSLGALLLLALGSSSAMGRQSEPTTAFSIDLDDVRPDDAKNDLLNLFIRENENQTRIILTFVNRKISRGRAKPKFFYLENLRVKPGDIVRVVPEGRARYYEAKIETIEARFPPGKPPQFQIIAFGEPLEPLTQSTPYPRLSTEGFQGQRTLDKTETEDGQPKPDKITCLGDTPGDLRIRFGTLVDVVDVGLAFSTVYLIDDATHTWDPTNGLKTRYRGERHRTGKRATR